MTRPGVHRDGSLEPETSPGPAGDGGVAAWRRLREHIRANLRVVIDEPDRLGLVWTFPDVDGLQRQYIAPVTAFALPHVMITANVATPTAMGAYDALVHNSQLAIGALCVHEGHFLLRAVLPLDGVDVAVIVRSLELVAHEAARLRTKATPKPAPAPYYE